MTGPEAVAVLLTPPKASYLERVLAALRVPTRPLLDHSLAVVSLRLLI